MAAQLDTRTLQLQEPLIASGVASVNFFNGRLLAGGDLTREQQARREYDQRLGLAVGDGVAFGLEVDRAPNLDQPAEPVLRVQAGLAINRRGQTLRLLSPSAVALTRRFGANADADCQCSFLPCEPVSDGSYVAGAGIYILTIAPAQKASGKAPSNGLDPADARCSTDAMVEAPQFRLVEVPRDRYTDLDVGSPLFRNRLAYRCFGAGARQAFAAGPWPNGPATDGLVEHLRGLGSAGGLTDADVPLALIYWTSDGLSFVDNASVRRGLAAPPAAQGWPQGIAPARPVLGEAMFLQFQEELTAWLAALADPAKAKATDRFALLPPVGLVPMAGTGGVRGFDAAAFFGAGAAESLATLDADDLRGLLRESFDACAVDLARKPRWQLYDIWQRIDAGTAGSLPQRVLVFAGPHLRYRGMARFGHARWGQSRWANDILREGANA